MNNRISIVFAINDSYAQHCSVSIVSILENNAGINFDFYVIGDYFSEESKKLLNSALKKYDHGNKIELKIVDDSLIKDLKINIKYITHHTYYRLLLAELFPDLNKILYLDADLVIDGSILELWNTPFDGYLCAGVKDTYVDRIKYKYKIGLKENDLYINAGVILMNLEAMRSEKISEQLFEVAQNCLDKFEFQDQDIINWVLRGRIKPILVNYNYTTEDIYYNKIKDPVIIHYTGKLKPWNINEKCRISLKKLYFKYLNKTPYRKFIWTFRKGSFVRTIKKIVGMTVKPKKIRVALVIDEYFGGMGTAFGGYGFLARHYIARYLPNEEFSVEVLLKKNEKRWEFRAKKEKIDGIKVIIPPGKKFVYSWMKRNSYDIYLTIELTHEILKYERKNKPVIHWIQDPRPWSEWVEIQTVQLFPESCYWNSELYDIVHRLYHEGVLKFISQGYFLNEKAKELYRLPKDVDIRYFPNPIDIDYSFEPETYEKKNHILFIGRIASVKRGWLFCEIAKRMPQYEFFLMGDSFLEKSRNDEIMAQYRNAIPNLHFLGHMEGEEKNQYIKEAKILVNTSIHEALPVTFLEALAYGTLLVSCRNPENLTYKFGEFVGTVLGDGFDDIPKFVEAIERIMSNEPRRLKLSCEAVKYIREIHSVSRFQQDMRQLIKDTVNKE